MRILFVHAATSMSIGDVARGYRAALERQGHEIRDYHLEARMHYHLKAIPPDVARNPSIVAQNASETIICEAMYFHADLVLIISGLNVHPVAIWLLGKVGIRAAVIFTESPYDDVHQNQWRNFDETGATPDLTVFTNDLYSAKQFGWEYLAPSYDPSIHHPVDPEDEYVCDVLMIGTGWDERQQFLEAVDWTGIDLRLYGIWNNIKAGSPLYDHYRPAIVDNKHAPYMYCSAKINLSLNRKSDTAMTPGPRLFELAGCGAFQLTDPRVETQRIFGDSIPMFRTPQELSDQIRYYLENEGVRRFSAAKALDRVLEEDFDSRAAELVAALERRTTAAAVAQVTA